MQRLERSALVLALLLVFGGGTARAQNGATARDAGRAAVIPPPAEAPPDEEADDLPADHPPVEDSNPHSHVRNGGAMPGVFQAPEDTEKEDPSQAPGSIAVDLRDADDKPLAGEVITLGILINSIANGDSRKHLQLTTDAAGHALFTSLETASNIAYRVSSGYQGGSFAASPFQLPTGKSMHVVLHVYRVAHDLRSALIVCEAAVAAEMRDDRIQIEEALTVYNLGRTAWQPDDVRMALPVGYKAFNAQTTMSDQGVDEVNGAAKLRGTFGPGQHTIQFRWQLPWSGDKDVDFQVGLLPHVAIARVLMPAAGDIKLQVVDFPAADLRRDAQGQSFLVTERRLRPDEGTLSSLSIALHDLPTPGPGRLVATLLAAFGVGIGLVVAASGRDRSRPDEDPDKAKKALLDEILALERARAAEAIGPRTYERARRELIDALAKCMARASRPRLSRST